MSQWILVSVSVSTVASFRVRSITFGLPLIPTFSMSTSSLLLRSTFFPFLCITLAGRLWIMVSVAENTKVCLFGLNWEVLSISSRFSSSAKCPFSTMRSASSITRHLRRWFCACYSFIHLNVKV